MGRIQQGIQIKERMAVVPEDIKAKEEEQARTIVFRTFNDIKKKID